MSMIGSLFYMYGMACAEEEKRVKAESAHYSNEIWKGSKEAEEYSQKCMKHWAEKVESSEEGSREHQRATWKLGSSKKALEHTLHNRDMRSREEKMDLFVQVLQEEITERNEIIKEYIFGTRAAEASADLAFFYQIHSKLKELQLWAEKEAKRKIVESHKKTWDRMAKRVFRDTLLPGYQHKASRIRKAYHATIQNMKNPGGEDD